MATPDFKGLNRLNQMQRSPFGTSSSLRPNAVSGVVGQQYRRQQEMYNTAIRTARQAGRRGDINAAKDAIDLQDEANARGIAPGGIRRREDIDRSIFGRAQTMEQAARDNERTAEVNRLRARETLGAQTTGVPRPTAPATGEAPVNMGESKFTPPTMSSPTESPQPGASPMWTGGPGTWQNPAVIPGMSDQQWSGRPVNPPAPVAPAAPAAPGLGERLAQGRPAKREGMINGKPASYWSGKLKEKDAELDALAESRAQEGVAKSARAWGREQEIRNAPKATQVDEQAEYLDAIESYQKGLVKGGDIDGPLKRANEIYRTSNSLGQAKMVGALLRRASKLGNS